MYITTKCTHCGKDSAHEISVHCLTTTNYVKGQDTRSYILDDITVNDSLTEGELTELIIQTLLKHRKLNTDSEGLTNILKDIFGLSEQLAAKTAKTIESEKRDGLRIKRKKEN